MFGFSSSYIFRTMFKAFFLVVTIAGAHGLWLLPVLLTLLAGDKGEAVEEAPAVSMLEVAQETANPVADEKDDEVGDED